MSSALPKHIHSTGDLPKVAWAKGTYVYDVNGKQYIDGSGGPAVYCIGRSNAEVNAALAGPEVRARLQATGLDPVGGPQEEAARYVGEEFQRWTGIGRATGIQVD